MIWMSGGFPSCKENRVAEAQPKVSIIVPCYKAEQFLPRCLDSLMHQTLDGIEAICINDGSPDRCIDILRDYEARYPGKVVVIDKQNEGAWRGRFDGIKIAHGEYIGFVDSDDYVEPTFAEKLYAAAKAAEADVSVCGFHRVDLDTGAITSTELTDPRAPFVIREDPGRLLELNTAMWNKFFRASTLKSMHDLRTPPPAFEDLDFHLLAFLQNPGKVVYTPEPLVNYITHGGSLITNVREGQVSSIRNALLEVRGFYEDEAPNPEMLQALDALAFEHLGVSLMFRLSYDPDCDLKQAIADNTAFLDEHFPTWRTSPYFARAYAKGKPKSLNNVRIAHGFYTAGLMVPFLRAYRLVVDHGRDLKW